MTSLARTAPFAVVMGLGLAQASPRPAAAAPDDASASAPVSAPEPVSAPVPVPAPAPVPAADPPEPPPVVPPSAVTVVTPDGPLRSVEAPPDASDGVEPPYFPVNLGVLHPMAMNAAVPELWTNLDLALLLGRVGFVDGLQLAPVGWIEHDLRGAELGLAGIVEGRTTGAQIDGVFAVAQGPLEGVQIAGALAWASDRVRGISLAGVSNQVYGDVTGALVAGVVSVARKEVRGLQLAAVNVGHVEGLQLGLINVSAEVHGLQIGLINVARRIDGLQIGVLNVTDKLEGESLGVVPLPRRGGVHPVIWGSNSLMGNAGLKFASVYAYSILSAALHNRPKDPVAPDGQREAVVAAGLTLGARVPVLPGLGVAADVGGYRLFAGDKPLAGHDELYKLRVLLSFAIVPRLVPFAGGGMTVAVRGAQSPSVQLGPELCAGLEL
jgi:hypothetical protein